MNWLVLAFATGIAAPAQTNAQPCERVMQTLTVKQRNYVQVDPRIFGNLLNLYLYVPDIKTPFIGAGYRPFPMWVVEGVYGKPFVQPIGTMSESEFEQLRTSPNIRVTPIEVRYDERSKSVRRTSQSFKVRDQAFTLDVKEVRTGWFGADEVTAHICR